MKAILLDWDGVLCDSVSLYYDLYVKACQLWNKPFPVSDIEHFRNWYDPRWEKNYYELGFSEAEFLEVVAWSEKHLDYTRAQLFPGVAENLALWAQSAPLAIVSTTPSTLIRARLGDLCRYFQHFKGGEDGSSEKRQKVADTLKLLGVRAGVMVGDTPLDVDAGQFNGLNTVGVSYGWVTQQRIREANPTRLVDDPADLGAAVLSCL